MVELFIILGAYQRLILIGLLIPATAIFYIIAIMPFMGIYPSMLCSNKDNKNEYISCTLDIACSSQYPIKVDIERTIVNWMVVFGFYCDNHDTFWLIECLFFIGLFFGMALIAPLADYFGRKPMILFSSILISLAYLKLMVTEETIP